MSLEASLTRTAIIVVVGDEILTGKVEDCNSSLLCRELHALGWRVLRVCFPCCILPCLYDEPHPLQCC